MASYDELPRLKAESDAQRRAENERIAREQAEIAAARATATAAEAAPPACLPSVLPAETAAVTSRPPWQFKPGQSGNPAGRPKGSKNKVKAAAAAMLADESGELTRLAIEAVHGGDKTMLRTCFTRIHPTARSAPLQIELPETDHPESLSNALRRAQRAMSEGEISPQDATAVAIFINARLTAYMASLRIRRLEQALGIEWTEDDEPETSEAAEEETV